jgi:hypothetical protein
MIELPSSTNSAKPDSKEEFTLALVDRVSDRVAKGIPLRLAAAREGLTEAQYVEHLREHPELALRQDDAICEFAEFCIRKLLDVDDPSANIRWLLEKNIFAHIKTAQIAAAQAAAEKIPTVAGMTDQELAEFREAASHF